MKKYLVKTEVLSSIRLLKENNANIAGIIVTGKTPKTVIIITDMIHIRVGVH